MIQTVLLKHHNTVYNTYSIIGIINAYADLILKPNCTILTKLRMILEN